MEKSKTLLAPWQEGTIPLPVYTLSLLEGAKSHATIQTILDDPGVAYGVIRRGKHNRAAVYFLGLWNVDLFFEKGSEDYMHLKEMMAEGIFDRAYQKPFGVFNLSKVMGYPGVMNDHHRIREIVKDHPADIRALPTFGKNVSDYWILDERNGLYLRRTDGPNPVTPRNALTMMSDAEEYQKSLKEEYALWRVWTPHNQLWPPRIGLERIARSEVPTVPSYQSWRPHHHLLTPGNPRKRYPSSPKPKPVPDRIIELNPSIEEELEAIQDAQFNLRDTDETSLIIRAGTALGHLVKYAATGNLDEGVRRVMESARSALQRKESAKDVIDDLDRMLTRRIKVIRGVKGGFV